jgi:hypothetical protein
VLLFARDLSVPFTNNQAECDVRPNQETTPGLLT